MRSKLNAAALAVLAALALSACTTPQPAGHGAASMVVALHDASLNVTRVSVTVSGVNIVPAISQDLTFTSGQWSGTIGQIPAGTDRTFRAQAYDVNGVKLFEGSAGNVSITAGATAVVNIIAQQLDVHPPYGNSAPQITSLTAGRNTLSPLGSTWVQVQAYDPDADPLTIAWTATAGSFDMPDSPWANYSAPATDQVVNLTVRVTDSRGAESAATFAITVANTEGSANVTVSFNVWPTITAITATVNRVQPNQSTQLAVNASNDSGDTLLFSWSAGCPGTFSAPTAAVTTFTVDAAAPQGPCIFNVTVSDTRGGSHQGAYALEIGTPASINFAPQFTSISQSAQLVASGGTAALSATAVDPEGTPVTFNAWASFGALRNVSTSGGTWTADWVAPSCLPAGTSQATVSLSAQDGTFVTESRTFTFEVPTCTGRSWVTSAMIGPAGGTVSAPTGLELIVPPGALSAATWLTINETGTDAPTDFGQPLTMVYSLEPASTIFARPARFVVPGMPYGYGYLERHPVIGTGYDFVDGEIDASSSSRTPLIHLGRFFLASNWQPFASVTGSAIDLRQHSTGPIFLPRDLSVRVIRALNLDTGAITVGTGYSNGLFTVPNLLVGYRYLIQVETTWWELPGRLDQATVLALGNVDTGRDGIVAMDPNLTTSVTMNITNLRPWVATDRLDYWSPDTRNQPWMVTAGPPPVDGTVGFASNWDVTGSNEVLDYRGDVAYLAQVSQLQSANLVDYEAITRAAVLSPLTVTAGTFVGTGADMVDLSTQASADFNVPMSQFLAQQPSTGSGMSYLQASAGVEGLIGDPASGIAAWAMDGLTLYRDQTQTTDFVTGPMSYGLPVPGWNRLAYAQVLFRRTFQFPGTSSTSLFADVTVQRPFNPSGETLFPLVAPATGWTLDGVDAFVDRGFGPLQPYVAWSPPVSGSPTAYALIVERLFVDAAANRTIRQLVGSLKVATETFLTLPPGILQPNSTYVFKLRPEVNSLGDPLAPARIGYPFARATTVSGIYTTAP